MLQHTSEQLLIDHFKDLFEFSRDVIWTIAPNGSITYVSPAIQTLRGIDQKTARNQRLDEIHPPESAQKNIDYFTYMLGEISQGRKPDPFMGEMDYYHANGSIITTEVYAVPLFDQDGKFMFLAGLSRDISSRLLNESQKNAERTARDAEFRSMLNLVLEHEARNALSLISNALDDASSTYKIDTARKATRNLIEVLNQINLFSQSIDEKTEFTPKAVALGPIIQEIEKIIAPDIPLILSDVHNISVWGEYSLVHMCLLQLIGNAVKYSTSNQAVRIEINHETNHNNLGAKIKITNSHDMQKPLNLEKLFEPFYRAPYVTNISGSGLGLTIVARLANMMSGDIKLKQDANLVTAELWLNCTPKDSFYKNLKNPDTR